MDKKKQAANAAMDELLDSTVGLENYVVADIPISNTRSALYIYLNSSVRSLSYSPTSPTNTCTVSRTTAHR